LRPGRDKKWARVAKAGEENSTLLQVQIPS
jgi:hypothetical protein